jgi:hypothetical protein
MELVKAIVLLVIYMVLLYGFMYWVATSIRKHLKK